MGSNAQPTREAPLAELWGTPDPKATLPNGNEAPLSASSLGGGHRLGVRAFARLGMGHSNDGRGGAGASSGRGGGGGDPRRHARPHEPARRHRSRDPPQGHGGGAIDAGAMRWADLADGERFQWCLHPKAKVSSKAVYIQIKETRRMMREDVDVDAPTHVAVSPVSLSESKANADQSANALGNCKMRRAAKSNEFRETMLMRDEDVDASLLLCASDVGLL